MAASKSNVAASAQRYRRMERLLVRPGDVAARVFLAGRQTM